MKYYTNVHLHANIIDSSMKYCVYFERIPFFRYSFTLWNDLNSIKYVQIFELKMTRAFQWTQ